MKKSLTAILREIVFPKETPQDKKEVDILLVKDGALYPVEIKRESRRANLLKILMCLRNIKCR